MTVVPANHERRTSGSRSAGPQIEGPTISGDWRDEDLSLYLDRCQIDTPGRLVEATWRHVEERRSDIGKVVDFGAGDGRFALHGRYTSYVGYEIDSARWDSTSLPNKAELVHQCAFSQQVDDADLCIGNPPFVRNQDLPSGWRRKVTEQLLNRSGLVLSGLANAWQYFFLHSLLSARDDGLCALVIPYEWVSRPSTRALRDYIGERGWEVDVYRLDDASFDSVLTTSSITVVDKGLRTGRWRYFAETSEGVYHQLPAASVSAKGYLPYLRYVSASAAPRATRGLSPGNQKVFTLTEAERSRFGLKPGRDVVACVTSLRGLPKTVMTLDDTAFTTHFRDAGRRCWLLRTDRKPSRHLNQYLESVPVELRATATCTARAIWWCYVMPDAPDVLVATSFKGRCPKMVVNSLGARAVGSVGGVFGLPPGGQAGLVASLANQDIADRIVAHANGLHKIEINQLNGLLATMFEEGAT